jgi:hypothetical protein
VPLVEQKYQKKQKQKNKNLIPTSAKRQNRGNLLFSMCIVGYLLVLSLWPIIFDPCSLLAATTVLIHF